MLRKKGEKGYRKSFRVRQSLKIIFFIIIILLQVLVSKLNIFPELSKIFLVTAILTCLPMANLLTPLLASSRMKSDLKKEYAKLKEILLKSEIKEEHFLYELMISTKKGFASTDFIYINKGTIYIFVANNFDIKELKNFISQMLKNNNLSAKIQISNNFSSFLRGIENINSLGEHEEIKKLLKALSL